MSGTTAAAVDLRAADAGWSYLDNFGDFPPGITFGRIYEYATMPAESLQEISRLLRSSRSTLDGFDITPDEMPAGVRFLSRFVVAPGMAADRVRCR